MTFSTNLSSNLFGRNPDIGGIDPLTSPWRKVMHILSIDAMYTHQSRPCSHSMHIHSLDHRILRLGYQGLITSDRLQNVFGKRSDNGYTMGKSTRPFMLTNP